MKFEQRREKKNGNSTRWIDAKRYYGLWAHGGIANIKNVQNKIKTAKSKTMPQTGMHHSLRSCGAHRKKLL